eukprot:14071604-Alexandrium_andersonii.AAC.1
MSASLVGSEMCIRDRPRRRSLVAAAGDAHAKASTTGESSSSGMQQPGGCLLYTSDAADDM